MKMVQAFFSEEEVFILSHAVPLAISACLDVVNDAQEPDYSQLRMAQCFVEHVVKGEISLNTMQALIDKVHKIHSLMIASAHIDDTKLN